MNIINLGWIFLLVLGVVMMNTALMIVEVSLVKLRRKAIDKRQRNRLRKHGVLSIAFSDTDRLSWVMRVLVLLGLVGLGFLLPPLIFYIEQVIGIEWSSTQVVWLWILVVSLVVGVQLILGELVIRGLGSRKYERNLSWTLRPLSVLAILLAPFIWLEQLLFKKILTALKIGPEAAVDPVEVHTLIQGLGYEGGALSAEMQKIIRNTLRMSDLVVADILLPRNQTQYLDLTASIEENLEIVKKSGHTRFPLCQGGLDECTGIVHLKDLFLYAGEMGTLDLREFQRQVIRFPEKTSLETALRKLLRFRTHMALVVDEFGGVIGIVTLEDLLEELVGAIQDEFDMEAAMIVPMGENRFKVSGLAPIHELETMLGFAIVSEAVSTFGGLITTEIGRIPEKGEVVKIRNWSVKIDEVTTKRIISATLRVHPIDDSE